MPAGRPTKMTPEVQEKILDRIVQGESLVKILKSSDKYPAYSKFCAFLDSNEEFREKYVRAKEAQADFLAEEILEIADDGRNDKFVDENGKTKIDYDNIQRSRLRVDTRKWIASKLKPKKYSERIQQDHSGIEPANLVVINAGANPYNDKNN